MNNYTYKVNFNSTIGVELYGDMLYETVL
ncbi:putative translational regulatory protein ArgL [Brenneria alni]